MSLKEALQKSRAEIIQRWLDRIFATYPPDAAKFFAKKDNAFSNPVGQTFVREIEALWDAFASGAEPEALRPHLEKIVRIRSIQSFTASQVVAFVFELKKVVHEVIASSSAGTAPAAELEELDARVDGVGLLAFDVYSENREELFRIRVSEVKRSVSGLLRRLNRASAPVDGDEASSPTSREELHA